MDGEARRKCSSCGRRKPFSEYHRDASRPGGVGYVCRACVSKKKARPKRERVRVSSKRCSKCGEEKPLSAYYRHPETRDGRQSRCVACMRRPTISSLPEEKQSEIGRAVMIYGLGKIGEGYTVEVVERLEQEFLAELVREACNA